MSKKIDSAGPLHWIAHALFHLASIFHRLHAMLAINESHSIIILQIIVTNVMTVILNP